MRYNISFLILLAFASVGLAESKPALPDDTWYAVHVTVNRGAETDHGSGTPFAFENGKTYIVTNAHVVESNQYPITVFVDTKSFNATYVAGSRVVHTRPNEIDVVGPDLCIVSVDTELDTVQIGDTDPELNASLFIHGFAGAVDRPILNRGKRVPNNIASPCLTSTILSANGDSGAGVIDADGRLVGVHWGGENGVAYAITLDILQQFVIDNQKVFPDTAFRVELRREIRKVKK